MWSTLGRIVASGIAIALIGCGGGGGSGSAHGNGPLRVLAAEGFPNGKFFPIAPSPATWNQCIWIELTAAVDPATVFCAETSNGLASAVRMLAYFYCEPESVIGPATRLSRALLPGVAVLDGRTNFDPTKGRYGSAPTTSVTHASLNIHPAVPLTGGRASCLVFVADTDGDLETIESFLPSGLRHSTGRRMNAQITVHLTGGLKSTGGRNLSPDHIASFVVGAADRIPPVVESVAPAVNAEHVDVGSAITLQFSEPIDATTVRVAAGGSPVPSTIQTDNLQVYAQLRQPGQQTPQPFTLPVSITPSTGLTARVTIAAPFDLPGDTRVVVNLSSAANPLAAAPPYPASSDPSGNLLAPNDLTDGAYAFTTAAGPSHANNPIDPEAIHFITDPSGLGTVRTNPLDRVATAVEDRVQEVNARGDVIRIFPGRVQDGVVGPFIANLLGTGSYTINQPVRQGQYAAAGFPHRGNPPTPYVVEPGKYAPPLWEDTINSRANPRSGFPHGVYLFVTNDALDVVHCVNSQTFQIVKDLPAPDPRGVGISPDLSLLYVSDFGSGTLTVLDVTAGPDGLPRGALIRHVRVGNGPWGVAAQPNGEDVLVCNRTDRTVSVVQVSNLGSPGDPVRANFQAGDPYEVTAGPRLVNLLLPYYAFVTNPGTNAVTVFESGPPQINGFGRDQVIEVLTGLARPTGISGDQWYNRSTYLNPVPPNDSMTGAFVVMNGNGTVAHLKATRFSIPYFPNPPPALLQARFEFAAHYSVGESPRDVCVDNNILYGVTPDGKQWPYVRTNPPVTAIPSRIYVTLGDGSISVHEIRLGRRVAWMKAGGASRIFGYFTQ